MAKKTTPKNETPSDLPSLLQGFADTIQRSSPDFANAYALVLKLGRSFTPQPRPKGIRWGQRQRCYENAFGLLADHPAFTYCEGFVLTADIPIPVEHAWCIDEVGRIVDNTLRDTGIAYFGIPFDSKWATHKVTCGAESLLDELLALKKIPKTAIAKPYRR